MNNILRILLQEVLGEFQCFIAREPLGLRHLDVVLQDGFHLFSCERLIFLGDLDERYALSFGERPRHCRLTQPTPCRISRHIPR